MVLPEDVGRVGLSGAAVLALVRYVTALDYQREDRLKDEDGNVYWKVSYADLGESMGGVSKDSIGRVVTKLEAAGELASLLPDIAQGDQTKAYRIPPDQPEYESASVPTSQNAKSQRTVAKTRRSNAKTQRYQCENAFSSLYREEREVQEEKEVSWHPAENNEPEARVNQGDQFAPSRDEGADEEDSDDWEPPLRNGHASDLFDIKSRKTEAAPLALAALPAVVDVEAVPEEPRPQCTTPSCGRVATDDPKFFKYQICGKCAAYADLNKDLERLPVLRGGAA